MPMHSCTIHRPLLVSNREKDLAEIPAVFAEIPAVYPNAVVQVQTREVLIIHSVHVQQKLLQQDQVAPKTIS